MIPSAYQQPKRLGVTRSGLVLIGIMTGLGATAVFFVLFKAGLSVKQLIEAFAIGLLSLGMVLYIIVTTVGLLRPREGAQLFSRRRRILLQLFAIPSLALVLLMGYDAMSSSLADGNATVLGKSEDLDGNPYLVISEGGRRQEHDVSAWVYGMVKKGDRVRFKRSRIFENWREVVILREGKRVLGYRGMGDIAMMLVGLLFAVPLVSFLIPWSGPLPPLLASHPLLLLIVVPILEIIVILFWVVYFGPRLFG